MRKSATPVVELKGLTIDRKSQCSIANQVSGQIRQRILDATLRAGDRLPGIRTLARSLSVSVDPIVIAYATLRDEGWILSHHGSGYTVAADPFGKPLEPSCAPAGVRPAKLTERARIAAAAAHAYRSSQYAPRPFLTYGETMAQVHDTAWSRIAAAVNKSYWSSQGYSDPRGDRHLTEAIARRLRQYRGIDCEPEQVIVTSGMVQNLSLCAAVLFGQGDLVGFESPAPALFTNAMVFQGLQPVSIPVDDDGLRLEGEGGLFSRCGLAGILTVPSTHVPMSVMLPAQKRRALLDWSRRTDGWILECGMEDLFAFSEGAPASLLASAPHDRIVYMDSFTLQFFPGIRTGYIVCPRELAEAFRGAVYLTSRFVNHTAQKCLADFLSTSDYDSYLRRVRRLFEENRKAFWSAAAALAPYGRLNLPPFGVHATLMLDGIDDTVASQALRKRGLSVRALSTYETAQANRANGLLLGFGTFRPEEIASAVRTLAGTLEKLSGSEWKGRTMD